MPGLGDQKTPGTAGRGHLRASHADRERMIDVLKAAFAQGRLSKGEFEARVGQALAARTYAQLATAGDMPRPASIQPPGQPPRRRVSHAARWGASGLVTPAFLATAFVFAAVRWGGAYEAASFVIAFVYFVFWLATGADILWEWHCESLPGAGMCVRCSHTAAAHPAPDACLAPLGSLNVRRRCSCAGYVPPGLSPEVADRREEEYSRRAVAA